MELTNHSFEFYYIAFFGVILVRYFLVSGITYWLFYSPFSQSASKPRVHQSPTRTAIWHDIKLSMLSSAVFALAAALILSVYTAGGTKLYTDPREYGLWYLGVSYGISLLLQDTYFYFTHRLFHHPKLFSWLHQGHHRSRYPTPWTSFAFDPLEAVVQALFLVGLVFLLPLHFHHNDCGVSDDDHVGGTQSFGSRSPTQPIPTPLARAVANWPSSPLDSSS